jgi:hypothetical protein
LARGVVGTGLSWTGIDGGGEDGFGEELSTVDADAGTAVKPYSVIESLDNIVALFALIFFLG